MTDPQNHLDLARTELAMAESMYGDTPRENAATEHALMGIGHALLAIHDQLKRPTATIDSAPNLDPFIVGTIWYEADGFMRCKGCGWRAGHGHSADCPVARPTPAPAPAPDTSSYAYEQINEGRS